MKTLLLSVLLIGLASSPSALGQSMPVGEAPSSSALADSAWPVYHAGPARQASTLFAGPETVNPAVQTSFFLEEVGEKLGASPWHAFSDKRYRNSHSARTLWGSSLQYVYKYEVDGDRFAFVDAWKLQDVPFFIAWNFAAISNGQIVVPAPNGLQSTREEQRSSFERCTATNNGTPPRQDNAALLVFTDGSRSDSPIRCQKKFEFKPEQLRTACSLSSEPGRDAILFGGTAIGTDVLYNGDLGVRVRVLETGGDAESLVTYQVILDAELDDAQQGTYKGCLKIGGETTNGIAMLPEGPSGSRMYIATNDSVVEVVYDPDFDVFEITGEQTYPYRSGRTGTTPTLLFASDGSQWLITIDAKCAVQDVFTGEIECAGGVNPDRLPPSELVAFRVPFEGQSSVTTRTVELPAFINTVENSPAVANDDIVVSNYAGFEPATLGPLGRITNIERGFAKLSYRPSPAGGGRFSMDWFRDDLQLSGVPSMSAGSGLIYGSGAGLAEDDRTLLTSFFGIELDSGDTRFSVVVGPSFETSDGAEDQVFDQGNNTVIGDQGSAIFPGGNVLVRIRDEPTVSSPTPESWRGRRRCDVSPTMAIPDGCPGGASP